MTTAEQQNDKFRPHDGRFAAVAVLDRAHFTVPDGQLRQVSSVLTVVDGAIVHRTGKVDR
jgi:predicted amidohydrolase YtcJ